MRRSDYRSCHGSQEELDAVPDDMLAVKGAEVSILFREINDGMLRVSLRSCNKVNVGYFASIYGGGGHPHSAGCRLTNSNRAMQRFIKQMIQMFHKPASH